LATCHYHPAIISGSGDLLLLNNGVHLNQWITQNPSIGIK